MTTPWAWIPEHRAICAGDFFIWAFRMRVIPRKPSAIREWASALRDMVAKEPELFCRPMACPYRVPAEFGMC